MRHLRERLVRLCSARQPHGLAAGARAGTPFFSAGSFGLALVAGMALCFAAFAPAANAQAPQAAPSTSAGSSQLQEVVVTAQFRSQNVQQTPLAITAVSSAMLQQRHQTNLVQIANDAPSVTLKPAETAFGPSMVAFIRGIGQADFDPAFEPGVGIYIDDVYFGTLTGSLLDLLDLDRVEVLRGPQGTLSGMNSIGGSIKLFTQLPDAAEGSRISVLYGSRNHIEARASTDFVVVPDHFFIRMAAVTNHQDGYVNVYDFGCANPSFTATDINGVTGTYSVAPHFNRRAGSCKTGQEGGIGYGALRISARWLVNDRLDATFVGDVTNENQENSATTLLYANYATPGLRNLVTLPTTNGHQLPYDSSLVPAMIPSNPYASYSDFTMPALGGTPAYSGNDRVNLLSWGGSATVNFKITDTLTLKSISSLRGYSTEWYEDNDASPWPLGLGGENLEHHQFSQELRLSGRVGHLLDYTIGGFYFRELSVYGTHQDLWYAIGPGVLDFLGQDPILAHDKAGFVHTTWHLTDKLDLNAGVRYTSQDKDYTYVRTAPNGGTAAIVGSLDGVTGKYSGNRTDYRANLSYHWTDDLMTYVQVATGFKGGGVNPRPFFPFQAVQFNPEKLTSYELGLKSQWFNDTLRANADVYFSRYKDIQLALLNCDFLNPPGLGPGLPCALPYNAGDAHIKGAELSLEDHPIPGLEIDASGGYLQFEYVRLSSLPTGVTMGMTSPFTPKWTGNFGVQYRIPIGSYGALTPRLDADTRSQIYTNAVNGPHNRVAGYTLYNAHLTWQPPSDNWQISLNVLNLGNKLYYVNVFDLTGAGGGSVVGTPGAPLEVNIQLTHNM